MANTRKLSHGNSMDFFDIPRVYQWAFHGFFVVFWHNEISMENPCFFTSMGKAWLFSGGFIVQKYRGKLTENSWIISWRIYVRDVPVPLKYAPFPSEELYPHLINVGWWRGTVVERRSLAGELSLSCARPAADG